MSLHTRTASRSPGQQACLCHKVKCSTLTDSTCTALRVSELHSSHGGVQSVISRKLQGHESLQVITDDTCVALSLRPTYGKFLRFRICTDAMKVEFLDTTEFLKFKEIHAGELNAATSHTSWLERQKAACWFFYNNT